MTELNLSGLGISSLDGMEYFIHLQKLDCSDNSLESVDLSANTELKVLDISGNSLAEIDLGGLTQLVTLDVSSNQISSIDLSDNVKLESLDCSGNNISILDVTDLGGLTNLDCSGNDLRNIDLSGNGNLVSLDVSDNDLTSLDVSGCSGLETLDCSGNSLVSINVSDNQSLTSLDVSDNPDLGKVWLKDEEQEASITITKDDSVSVLYNEGGLVIPDDALRQYLLDNYDDDLDGAISVEESLNINVVNVSGKGVKELTGLEKCPNLTMINCSDNEITAIDLPNLANLATLNCSGNQIVSLSLSNLPKLSTLDCSDNSISVLSTEDLTALSTLYCYGNPIDKLNLTNCSSLSDLRLVSSDVNSVNGTELTLEGYEGISEMVFDMSGTAFTTLTCINSASLTKVIADGELKILNVYGNTSLTDVDVRTLAELETLDAHDSGLTSVDVSTNLVLDSLDVSGNVLTDIDVTKNTRLKSLDVSDNSLTSLNVRSNTALERLRVSNNTGITTLNVQKNTALTELYADGLSLSELNISKNTALTTCECHNGANRITVICWDDFSFQNTALSLDRYVSIVNTQGTAVVPELCEIFTINRGKGICAKVDGSSFWMLSVEHKSCKWSYEEVVTGATSEDDGLENMNIIKTNFDINNYPAFLWCDTYGVNWYLPAMEEASDILENETAVNDALTEAGIGKIYYIRTSTEINYRRNCGYGESSVYSSIKTEVYTYLAIVKFITE